MLVQVLVQFFRMGQGRQEVGVQHPIEKGRPAAQTFGQARCGAHDPGYQVEQLRV